jgi:hypothetical protein
MPEFQYTASDAHGAIVHGHMSAANRQTLAAQLGQTHLFLVSCTEHQTNPIRAAEPVLITDNDKQSPLGKKWVGIRNFFGSPKGMFCLFLLLGVGGMGDFMYFKYSAPKPTIASDDTDFLERYAKLHIGMSRADVELLFPNFIVTAKWPAEAHYAMGPHRRLIVLYDADGGAGKPSNRMKQPPFLMNDKSPQ